MTNNTIIIIPARLSSTRLPNKPILDISGKSMIVRVWESAIAAEIGPVLVAAGDSEIFENIKKVGGNCILTDPNLPSGTDRIAAALKKFDVKKKYNKVINLQGDMPYFPSSYLKIVSNLINNVGTDMATLASPINKSDISNPNSVKVEIKFDDILEQNRAVNFSRFLLNDSNKKYFHHIGIYAFDRKALENFVEYPQSSREKSEKLEQLRAIEMNLKISIDIVDKTPDSIDTLEDLKLLRKKYN
ncbi:3-deoxy-manno-octulosonate cytidylyltransferase [Alphaproteobacteria bacterium]|nr:3-deoxy-manno-octulosonate cytidylyltransferase [Alphaproteobacteria bacterium]